MKQITFILIFLLAMLAGNSQNVGIGTGTPHTSSMLDINSSSKGMLTPRMSSAQRIAIISPAKGLLVFDTDTNTFWFYNGIVWMQMTNGAGGSLMQPYDGSINSIGTAFRVSNRQATRFGWKH